MQFNDYVLCTTEFGKIIAKFMMHRPDKDLIIVDYDNRLHQIPTKNVQYATNEHLHEFIQARLAELIIANDVANRSVDSFTKDIAEYRPHLAKLKRKVKSIGKQRDAKGVILRLMKANRQEGTEQHTKVSNEEFCLMENENKIKKEIYDFEGKLRQAEGIVKRGKKTLIGIKKAIDYWQTKKEMLKNNIRDIERGEY